MWCVMCWRVRYGATWYTHGAECGEKIISLGEKMYRMLRRFRLYSNIEVISLKISKSFTHHISHYQMDD